MAADLKVAVVGPGGHRGELTVSPLHTVADVRKKVAALVGDKVPFFKLALGDKVLRDLSAHFVQEANRKNVELTVTQLDGLEQMDLDKLQQFLAAHEKGNFTDGDLGLELKYLRVLNLVSFPGWLNMLVEKGYPMGKPYNSFLKALKAMTGLEELDLTGNPLSDLDALAKLGEALPRSLEVLRLSCPGNWMAGLAEGLLRGLPMAQLRELLFSEGMIQASEDVRESFVTSLARCLPGMTGLQKLSLRKSEVLPKDLSKLGPALPKSIKSLDLRENFCYVRCLPELKAFLSGSGLSELQELHLTCGEDAEDSQAAVREVLPEGCKVFVEPSPRFSKAPKAAATTSAAAAAAPVRGFWSSEGGECHIFDDKITSQLTYEEFIGDGSERLHGRLEEFSPEASGSLRWRAKLMILEEGQGPWYGPSCGPKPDEVGEIMVTLRANGSSAQIETRIKTDDDDDWQQPTLFKLISE